jgi:hypothetical protein
MDVNNRPIVVEYVRKKDAEEPWTGQQLVDVLKRLDVIYDVEHFWYEAEAWQIKVYPPSIAVVLAADVNGTPFLADGFSSFVVMDYYGLGTYLALPPSRAEVIRRVRELAATTLLLLPGSR